MTARSNSLAGPLLAQRYTYEQFWSLLAEDRTRALAQWLKTHTIGGGVTGTIVFRDPAVVAGGSTAPTAAQVTNAVIADVTMVDAATITTVVHSLAGVSTNGADGSPFVHLVTLTAGATPVGCGVTVSFTTNGVQLANLTTAAGNGQTYRVYIWRHSIITNYTK